MVCRHVDWLHGRQLNSPRARAQSVSPHHKCGVSAGCVAHTVLGGCRVYDMLFHVAHNLRACVTWTILGLLPRGYSGVHQTSKGWGRQGEVIALWSVQRSNVW